jgi:hypothetical protein
MRLSGDYNKVKVQGVENLFRDQCFRYGDCGLEVYHIVKRALLNGIRNFRVIDGMVYLDGNGKNPVPHTWIEVNGTIKDPTASQFSASFINYATSESGEYREEYTPKQYVDYFEDQYGELLTDEG